LIRFLNLPIHLSGREDLIKVRLRLENNTLILSF
jgi:hypothetical protein